jgi:tripeptidyl-peptidase-1
MLNMESILDGDAVNALVAHKADTITAVELWRKGAGLSQVAIEGHFANFATTASTANSLLSTPFLTYQNTGILKIRAKESSIPDVLVPHMDLISTVTHFGKAVANFLALIKMTR